MTLRTEVEYETVEREVSVGDCRECGSTHQPADLYPVLHPSLPPEEFTPDGHKVDLYCAECYTTMFGREPGVSTAEVLEHRGEEDLLEGTTTGGSPLPAALTVTAASIATLTTAIPLGTYRTLAHTHATLLEGLSESNATGDGVGIAFHLIFLLCFYVFIALCAVVGTLAVSSVYTALAPHIPV